MSLPLQPGLDPWPPHLRRLAAVLALALAVLLVGLAAPRRGRPPELILGGPGIERDYARAAERLIAGARRRCWMAMFVIRPEGGTVSAMLEALAAAAARGVDVRVALDRGLARDGTPDDKHAAPAAWLAGHGVRVILDEPDRTTHAKLLVVDGIAILAGSHNWTTSAVTSNREASWLVEDEAAARRAEAWLAAIPGWEPPPVPAQP